MSLYNDLNLVLTPYANKIKQNEANVRLALSLEGGGAPTVVASTSAMTDTEQIYVLSTNGMWYYHNGSAWVAGGEYGAVSTDTTLTQAGMPADAEAVGDRLAATEGDLDALNVQINGGEVITPVAKTLSDFTLDAWYIETSSGKWANQSNRGYFIAIPSTCRKISLVGTVNTEHPSDSYSECAYLANIEFSAGQAAPIIGASLPTVVQGGNTFEEDVPTGANYFYIRRLNGNGRNIEPTNIIFYLAEQSDDSIVGAIDALQTDVSAMNTATTSDVGKALKAKTVSDGKVTEWEFGEAGTQITVDSELDENSTNPVQNAAISTVVNGLNTQINGGEVLTPVVKTLSDFTLDSWYIETSSGKWASQSNRGYFIAIPSSCRKISLVGKTNEQHPTYAYSEYACLGNINFVSGENAPIMGASLPSRVEGGETAEVTVPTGSNYFYVRRLNADGENIEPTNIIFYIAEQSGESIVGEITALQADVSAMNTATASDVGNALKAKTVSDGKVTEWEFGEAGAQITVDSELDENSTNPVQNAVISTMVNGLNTQINGGETLIPTAKNISDFTLQDWYVSESTGKWVSHSNRGYYIAIPSTCRKISLVGTVNTEHPSDAYSECACLANIDFVSGETAPIVGASLPTRIEGGETAEIAIPAGANYFYVRRLNPNGRNIEPTNILFYLVEQSDESIVGKLSILEDSVSNVEGSISDLDTIKDSAPFVYTLENKFIAVSTGVISTSSTSVLSDIFLAKSGTSITADSGYGFRFVFYSSAEAATPSGASNWVTEYTFSQDMYVRFQGRYSFNENVYVTPESITPHITENIGLAKTYIEIASEAQLSEYKKYNPYNLNEVLYNNEDMIWTWWTYPQAIHFERVRDKIYWIFTTRDGFSGVASYDFHSKQTTKTMLKKAGTDDHNAPAVFIRSNGHIIVAYAGGHNTDRYMHVRHSSSLENIEHFEDEVLYESWSVTCYAQIFEYNGALYIFYRRQNDKWMYIKSTDGGYTWQDEVMIINANIQYYCKVTPTTTDGVLRLVMYSNPTEPDPRIRMGFLHLDTGKIYNADNSTELGTSDIAYTSFSILWELDDATNKPYQRMFDVAITAPSVTRILYAQFSDDESGDAIYTMYDSGTKVTICPAGTAIWIPKYQCGCAFINPNKIVVAYNSEGKDYITLWDYANGAFTKTKTVYEEATGTLPIRNARPIVDTTGEYILWHRGYYRSNSFTDFVTDAKLYSITDDEILL